MDFNEWHYLVSSDQKILELKNQHLLQSTTAGLTRKKEESEHITNTVADVAQACFSQVQHSAELLLCRSTSHQKSNLASTGKSLRGKS
jgi:hypothetical protein